MRTSTSFLATSAIALTLALSGCSSPASPTDAGSAMSEGVMSTPASSMAAPMPTATAADSMTSDAMTSDAMTSGSMAAVLHGMFAGENGRMVGGTVTVTDHTVTLTGFSTDEGPDLHFYLANGTDEAAIAAGVEIGAVSSDAAQTITLPAGVSASDYRDLVVRCDKAEAVFGVASLGA